MAIYTSGTNSSTMNFGADVNEDSVSRELRTSSRQQEFDNDRKIIQSRIDQLKEIQKQWTKEQKKEYQNFVKWQKNLDSQSRLEEWDEQREFRRKYNKEDHEERMRNLEEEGKHLQSAAEGFRKRVDEIKEDITSGRMFANMSKSLSSTLDPIINGYLEKQTAISAHLSGSSKGLNQITDRLQSALSTSSLVKQEAVYNKLATLVESGIIYNVEQRAFLQTLAEDMHFQFSASGPLARLIRLQQQDSTANRLALEYNLQVFLNQSYQNSQYIADAFTQVSDSLFEMRALNSTTGAGVENTLQTWLGALYSNGLSGDTATSLAKAFNQLGSGDISNLGQGISNLVLMGVARAGLDYGDILNSGLNANQTNQIMSGISTYLQEMGANSSNVVKSQLASIFGVNVADLIAASNTGVVNTTMNDNIGTLLSNYDSFVSGPNKMMNILNNFLYSWGTNVAQDPLALGSYKIMELLAPTLSSFVGGNSTLIGNIIAASPSIPLLYSLVSNFGELTSSFNKIGLGNDQLSNIFTALGTGMNSGSTTVKISGGGTSASAYIGNGDMTGMFSNTKTSAMDIADTFNIEGIKAEWEDNVQTITENSVLMLDIMQNTMESMMADLSEIRDTVSIINDAFQFGQVGLGG